jgi:hypothetical protein
MSSNNIYDFGDYSIISNNGTEDNGKVFIWSDNKWNFIFKFQELTINTNESKFVNSNKITFFQGTLVTIKNKNCIDKQKFPKISHVYSFEFLKKTKYNSNIIDIVNNNIIHLKTIGLYKITYNIAWHLKENIEPCEYLTANKEGILAFCHENTNTFINTSISKSKGNSFIVNLTHTFLYEKIKIDITHIQLYIYKLYTQYMEDIHIESSNTWLEIEYSNL